MNHGHRVQPAGTPMPPRDDARNDSAAVTINRLYDHLQRLEGTRNTLHGFLEGIDGPQPEQGRPNTPQPLNENLSGDRPMHIVGSLAYLERRIELVLSDIEDITKRIAIALG